MNKFNSERGAVRGFFGWIFIGVVLIVFALLLGTCNLLGGDNSSSSRAGIGPHLELISHEDEGGGYEDDNGGGYTGGHRGGDYGGGKGGDNDQRGDHNCRNFCVYGVPEPGEGEQQPQSLFPPTPAGIRDFVTNVIKSGLEMGQLFADVTIKFVGDLMVGVA